MQGTAFDSLVRQNAAAAASCFQQAISDLQRMEVAASSPTGGAAADAQGGHSTAAAAQLGFMLLAAILKDPSGQDAGHDPRQALGLQLLEYYASQQLQQQQGPRPAAPEHAVYSSLQHARLVVRPAPAAGSAAVEGPAPGAAEPCTGLLRHQLDAVAAGFGGSSGWKPACIPVAPAAAEPSIPSSRAQAAAAWGKASAAEGAASGEHVVLQQSIAAAAAGATQGTVGPQQLQQSHSNGTAAAAAATLTASCAPAGAAAFPAGQRQFDTALGSTSLGYCAPLELPPAPQVGVDCP